MIVREAVRTESVDEAETAIAHLYPRGRFVGSGEPFRFEHRVAGDERATIAHFVIAPRTEIVADVDGVMGVGQVHGGRYRLVSNGDEVDVGQPFLLRPGEARSWSEDLEISIVNLDLATMARHRGSAIADARLQDLPTVARSPLHAQHWQRTVSYVAQIFDDPLLLASDLIRASAVDTLLVTALAVFAVDDPAGAVTARGTVSGAVARATQFIDDNAGRAIDTADVAAAARLSLRGLQLAFRRELQTTPMRHLRDVRLARVRAELLAATVGETAVADVARRWGFAHLGRFAHSYREAFGELPRVTLLR